MARRSPLKVGIALVLLCAVSHAQAEATCRSGCRGAPQTFKLKDGTTYKYNFDSKIEVSLSSAEGQKSVTEVKATVLLTQQAQCNQILRLQNVQIIGGDGKKHGNLPDVEKPIRLNYNDGHIEDSICVIPGDNQNSINLKRAIASVFQANLKSGHETDVFGLCPTEVAQHKEGNVLVVSKSRNLNRCAYRENIGQDFLATSFNLNSEIKTSPLLNADYEAKLKIKNGILDQAVIEESYLYIPFSVGSNGAKVNVETTLKYAGTAKDNAPAKVSQPRSIIFEDPHPINSPHSNVNSILQAVKNTANTVDLTVGETTAKEFANLVRILRVSKRDDLLAVYSQVRAGAGFKNKETARRIFLDALLRAGHGDNVEVVIELLRNKQLTEVEQNLVYLGLSLVRHPTEGSVTSVASLLSQPNLPRNAYLGIGNLVGRFCKIHSCVKAAAVNDVVQKLAQKLGNGKPTNREQENDIVYVLKALGNTKYLNDNILPKITAIAQDKKVPIRLRVTALEAYVADPCKDKLIDSALTILKDIQQDSEIRIKAYLALTQCPNSKVGNAVKTLLEHERSYQVGGFIVSHIRNIRASANPHKALAKQFLGLINVPKRFPFDLRKYSANGEFSYTIDTLGIANTIESNVIYSQKSFLPRSTSLNLTADVFGHTFNFLEIETRQENLDRLLEHYLGPRGILRSSNLQELWNNKEKSAENLIKQLKDRLGKTLRSRRDVSKAEIDQIAKQVQLKTNNLNNDLDLDLSIRVFGSEVLFLNVNDDIQKLTPEAIVDKIVEGVKKGVDQLKHFDETLQSNLLFLDAEFAYPTSAGFPLRLSVEGSANTQLKTSGAINIGALLNEENTEFKLALIPSANIEVAGRLTIDTLLVESGLKVVSTLHTSSGGDIIANIAGKQLDVKFSLPIEKSNIISANHEIVFENREWGGPSSNTLLKFAQNKDFSICLDQLNDFIGLTFCGEFNGPNLQGEKVPILPFPLSGDAKVVVTVEKDDLKEYHYKEAYYTDAHKTGAEIILEAIGKNGNKKIGLQIVASLNPEKFIKATLTSPITSASIEGRLTYTDSEKSVSLSFVQDQNEYFAKFGVAIQGDKQRAVYKPLIQYKTPENSALQVPPYHVEGQIIAENKDPIHTFTFDKVRLIIPDQKTITVNGNIGYEPETVFADVTVSDGSNNASFKGKLRLSPQFDKIKYNAELKNSLNPAANIRLKGEFSKTTEELNHSFQVAHGGDFSDKNNILTLENNFKKRVKDGDDYVLQTKNDLKYPAFGTELEFDFELKPKSVQYEVDIQYNNVKLGSELEFERNQKKDGDFSLEFGVWGLNNRVTLKSKRRVNGEISQVENSLDLNGKRIEVNGKVRHHIKPQDIDVGSDLIVKLSTHSNPFQVVNGLKLNPNEIDVSHKVTSGNQVFVDVFLKANRAGNANGSIKINLQKQLIVNGQIKANKGIGSGEIVIELPAAQQSVKLDTTFTIHEPNYNVLIDIYPIFNQDKTKKITLSTHTNLTPNSITSKNLVDIFGSKLEANVKGTANGNFQDGKINGEADLTLPNNHYIAGKINRDLKKVNNVLSGTNLIVLEYRPNKNQPGDKLTFKMKATDVNFEEYLYDINYNIIMERANGQNLNWENNMKRQSQGDSILIDITNKVTGSSLESPLETSLKSTYKHYVGNYDAKASYKTLGSIDVNGKYDLSGQGKPISGSVNLDVSSTSKKLKNLKASASGSLLRSNVLDAKGEASIFIDNGEQVVDLAGSGEVQASDKDGKVKGSVKSGKSDLVAVEAGIKRIDGKSDQQIHSHLSIQYDKGQTIKGDVTLIRLSKEEYKVDVKVETPNENLKSGRLQVHTKRNEDKTHYQSATILTVNDKIWTSNTDLVLSEITPSINIKTKYPDGKLQEILLKVNKLSDRQLTGQMKLVNQAKDFLLEGSIDANLENVDNFHIKITANSPTLKIDKYVIEAQNKPAKTGRRIQVTAKSGNKNILAGSTSYTAREEHGKLIVEGSGSFKVRDETKSANFKFIKQNLVQAKNGETGIEVSFDAGLGNQAIDAELKITNKQFRILNSYCEEKKQCAHVEVDIKTDADDISNFHQEIEIAVDLRKLGLSHEFGLKAVTKRKEYVLDHTVDIHFQSQENSKYQYSLYIHPKTAGVSLTTPKRVIALESNIKFPQTILKEGGRVSGEVAFWTNKKNQADKKVGIIAYLNIDPKGQSLDGEAKFTNPALKRPLSVKVNSKYTNGQRNALQSTIVLDIFAQPNQQLVINYKSSWPDLVKARLMESDESLEITSSGLGINIVLQENALINLDENVFKYKFNSNYDVVNSKYKSLILYEISPTSMDIVLTTFNIDWYKLSSKLQLSKEKQIINSEMSYLGYKPLVSHLEIKNLNTLKYSLSKKESPNDKLVVNAGLIPGQIADLRAEILKGGSKHELGYATVKLDDANFLKSDYNVNSKLVEELLLKPIQDGLKRENEQIQKLSDQIYNNIKTELKNLGELANKVAPNLEPLRKYYVNELNAIKDEILQDKTIKEISDLLYNILSAILQAFGDSFNNLSATIETIAKNLYATFGKLLENLERDLLPKLKKIWDQIFESGIGISDAVVQIVLTIGAKLVEIAEKYRPELQHLANVVGEVSQDVLKAGLKVWEAISTVIVDQWRQICNEIKQIPAFEQLIEEYKRFVEHGLPAPEAIAATIKDVLSTIKDIAPTEELKALVDAIGNYLELKITSKQVDDRAAIDKIIKAAIAAVKRLIAIITGGDIAPDLQNINVPLPVNILSKLPRLAAVRFSPLNYLLLEEDVVPADWLLSLVNHPRNWFAPFPLYGIVAQGQHIFTFDGKHLTFPGKCNYLLARDAVDGNFTVVGTYTEGILTAISLNQGSETMTLKKGGHLLVNNAQAEFPARKPHLVAFRDLEKIVILSDYGVRIICGEELLVCSIKASGFYHGKLRGLLGNGNNERYDDFTLPSEKVVSAEGEFGNAYKLSSSCPAVTTVSHTAHHSSPKCEQLFGWESSLRYCHPFVGIANFKLACEHGIAAGVKDTEYAIAVAYVAACNQHGIPARLPSEFVRCTNGDKPAELGDKFSVRTPNKAADIVLLVNTNKETEPVYKEYVQPLVQQLTSDLNSKGINDINFHLIAYGGENQWPSHITTNNGKLTFKGKSPNLKFSDDPVSTCPKTNIRGIDDLLKVIYEIKHDVELAVGLDLPARTYWEGSTYRFRATAIKSIIATVQKPCEVGRLYPLQLLRTLFLKEKTISLNLITPIAGPQGKGEAKNIVGFNSRDVSAIGATKNKVKSFSDLSKVMEYNDYCVDFTVENDGNVFASDHFLQQPKGQRKQFIQLTSHAIVNQLVGIERGFDCECKYRTPYSAANVCSLVFSKDKSPAKKTGTKG